MNQIHGWSNSMVLLCCVLSFLTLPTNAINLSQNNEKHIRINNHKTTEYASQKLNDLLNNKKRRVRRQVQTSLQLQLAQALQQNPGIAQQLQQNPELLANLRKKLADVYSLHNTQNQQQERLKTPIMLEIFCPNLNTIKISKIKHISYRNLIAIKDI